MMRSKLFVPGSRDDLFSKALAGDADALSFDVEDSVPESGKELARGNVVGCLRSAALQAAHKLIIVRVNASRSSHFEPDLRAFASVAVDLINLPKVESADEVVRAVAVLERAERDNDVRRPIGLLVNIETARALRLAREIATAHARVVGLQLGLADLFESLGIDRGNPDNVHAAMFALRLAAGEAGRLAYDGAFPDVRDADGFRREAERARALGFVGKSCIHPSQVGIANEVFSTGELDVDVARRIVAAAETAEARGHGAFLVDGRMIDAPFLERARALLNSTRAGRERE